MYVSGSDVEDSLYWIAYATQPSNVTPQPISASPFYTPAGQDSPTPLAGTSDSAGVNAGASVEGIDPAGGVAEQNRSGKYVLRPEHEELRRRIAIEAMGLSQRVPRVKRQCAHEQERISRLAEVYQVFAVVYFVNSLLIVWLSFRLRCLRICDASMR